MFTLPPNVKISTPSILTNAVPSFPHPQKSVIQITKMYNKKESLSLLYSLNKD